MASLPIVTCRRPRQAAPVATWSRLMSNNVTAIAAAPSSDVLAHFEQLFRFETDCWDVHVALSSGAPGFVLLDVRGPGHFRKGHVSEAIGLPHGKISATRMAAWAPGTLFVVYCAGPHCNGAARAAI